AVLVVVAAQPDVLSSRLRSSPTIRAAATPTALSDAASIAMDVPTPSPNLRPAVPTMPLASPALTPPPPVVSGLVVCDSRVGCGERPTGDLSAVVAGLRVTQGTGQPLVLVVTSRDTTAADAIASSVVARSAPITASEMFACHRVEAVTGALPPGSYSLSVFLNATLVTRVSFELR